ncbi:hypothetical protein GST23_14010 [Serratia marcescens]|uniref:hypothetical protein n=2 Tax=Serratia marcescens TaxID=615 RepID=UPI001327162B|nr:hypothetical protein [Serratia marcescens]MXS94376.1 hypothetical protein [Serratia marcescens]QHJ25381.1 hypothetical protein GV243_06050 [Serratia marcescens]
MSQRYNTGNPRPSNSMKDLNDNALAYDDFLNSDDDEALDRFQRPFPTVRKQVAERIDEITGAQKSIEQYTYEAKQAADNAQNIADANTYYTTPEDPDGTIAGIAGTPPGKSFRVGLGEGNGFKYYINNNGSPLLISETPGVNSLGKLSDELFGAIQNYPDSALSIPNIGSVVEFDAGVVAPFMSKSGRVGSVDEFGEWQDAAFDNSLVAKFSYKAQDLVLSDGSICREVILDADKRIIEAWTYDGGYYLASESGLKRVSGGEPENKESAIVYASAVATIAGGVGTRVSVNLDDSVCFIFVTWGQSLAQGYNGDASDTLTAVTPLYPDNCLMFAGTRPNRGVTEITSLTPLKEAISAGGLKETAASSLASHTFQMVQTITGHSIRTLSFVAAEGGKAFQDLTKGTPAWQAMIQGVVDAKNICIKNGWKPVVACLDVMAGETDSENIPAMTTERYKRQLQQLDADFNSEVKRITKQSINVRIFVCQSAFTPSSRGLWDQPVRQAQYDLDGVGNIRLAGPVYSFPYADVIHINSLGQNRRGQMVSRALMWDFFGTGWRTIKLVNYIWRTPTLLSLVFDVPTPPLVIDSTGETITVSGLGNGMGFVLDDRSSTPIVISSVTLASNSVIDIALSSAPLNPSAVRVGYGIKRNDGNTTQDGPVVGARGCIRDSTNHVSLYDSATNHNWMPAFIKEIPF